MGRTPRSSKMPEVALALTTLSSPSGPRTTLGRRAYVASEAIIWVCVGHRTAEARRNSGCNQEDFSPSETVRRRSESTLGEGAKTLWKTAAGRPMSKPTNKARHARRQNRGVRRNSLANRTTATRLNRCQRASANAPQQCLSKSCSVLTLIRPDSTRK